MDPLVLVIVLGAALLHAGWNALAKLGGDPLVRMAIIAGAGGACAAVALPFVELPAAASWPWLVASALVHQAYFVFLVLAYRSGDLSLVYPVARGAAPLLVAAGALLVAGERLPWGGTLAMALVTAGVLSLAAGARHVHRGARAVVFALCTALSIAAYSVLDGVGGRASGAVPGYVCWLFLLEALPIMALALVRRRRDLGRAWRRHWRAGAVAGACSFVAYGVVIWAMTRAPMSYVSAVREVSVVLAAIIGARWLGEPLGRRRVAAAAVVAAGVVLLQLSR